jgi:hypothetical protein
LIKSEYCVGDLMAPVTDEMGCHISKITPELLGFMYFLIFEYVFFQRLYKGAPGRAQFIQKKEVIQFFVDIAENECESIFAPLPDTSTPEEVESKKTLNIDFYK